MQLIGTAELISRALDDALRAAGGSLPTWLVLVSLKGQRYGPHPKMGGEDSTAMDRFTHMETAGLVVRTADPEDQAGQFIELTEAGETLFRRMLRAVVAFDAQLRAGFLEQELAALSSALCQLRNNATGAETS